MATNLPIIYFQYFCGEFPGTHYTNFTIIHANFLSSVFCPRRLSIIYFFQNQSKSASSLRIFFALELINWKCMEADCLCLSTVNNAAPCATYSVNLSLKQVEKRDREKWDTYKEQADNVLGKKIIQPLFHQCILHIIQMQIGRLADQLMRVN